MKNFKLNNLLSIIIVILVMGGIWYFADVRPERDLTESLKSEESAEWQKAEYYNTPEGLPELTFNYAKGLRIEQNENQEPNTLTFSLINIEKEKKVLSGEEKDFFLIATDIVNLCYVGPNCFSNLPDVYKKYDFPGNEPLEEVRQLQYGENLYTVYKDPTQGAFPHSIYVLRIGTDRILGIHHFGDGEPPSTIDLESIRLTYLSTMENNDKEKDVSKTDTNQNSENINTWTGEPLGENQHISLEKDLNGDGEKEYISYEIAKTWNQNRLILNVNNTTSNVSYVPPSGDSNPANFFGVVDMNTKDNKKEIALQDYGPSDDFNVTFLGWNGKELVSYGNIPGDYTRMKFDGNGKITTQVRGQILQTWFHDADYILSGNKLVSIPRAFYSINYPQELIMLKDFSFLKSPKDKTTIFTAKKGDKVEMIGCDDVSWCMIKNASGVEGWFSVEDYGNIGDARLVASDIFEGLSYAD